MRPNSCTARALRLRHPLKISFWLASSIVTLPYIHCHSFFKTAQIVFFPFGVGRVIKKKRRWGKKKRKLRDFYLKSVNCDSFKKRKSCNFCFRRRSHHKKRVSHVPDIFKFFFHTQLTPKKKKQRAPKKKSATYARLPLPHHHCICIGVTKQGAPFQGPPLEAAVGHPQTTAHLILVNPYPQAVDQC